MAVTAIQIIVAASLRVVSLRNWSAKTDLYRGLARSWARGSAEQVLWAIEATARRLGPISTCLVRALAAELVLGGRDRQLDVAIGVRRMPDGSLAAHAWLLHAERVLIGATSEEFVPLASLSGLQVRTVAVDDSGRAAAGER